MRVLGTVGNGVATIEQIPFAWATFQGDASPLSVASSYNISAIQDNGTGDFSIVFIMPTGATPYCYIYNGVNSFTAGEATCRVTTSPTGFETSSSIRLNCRNVNDALFDPTLLSVTFYGV